MKVSVLGAGTMGHGIAQVVAMAENEVVLRDIDDSIIEDGINSIEDNLAEGVERGKVEEEVADATLDRISGTTDLETAVMDSDLVIEAIPEDLDLKREMLEDVETFVNDETIIATNTSSLSVTAIANVLERSERAIGLHFFNPVHIMSLVEIVIPEQASDGTLTFAREFVEDIDRTPVEITDSPGFASSRLGVALGVEAMRMVETGVASPDDIDTAMELGYNHPMGPLKLTDVIGLDVRLDVLEHLREELGERFRPPQILRRKVRAGKTGRKASEGFYVWEDGETVGTSTDGGAD